MIRNASSVLVVSSRCADRDGHRRRPAVRAFERLHMDFLHVSEVQIDGVPGGAWRGSDLRPVCVRQPMGRDEHLDHLTGMVPEHVGDAEALPFGIQMNIDHRRKVTSLEGHARQPNLVCGKQPREALVADLIGQELSELDVSCQKHDLPLSTPGFCPSDQLSRVMVFPHRLEHLHESLLRNFTCLARLCAAAAQSNRLLKQFARADSNVEVERGHTTHKRSALIIADAGPTQEIRHDLPDVLPRVVGADPEDARKLPGGQSTKQLCTSADDSPVDLHTRLPEQSIDAGDQTRVAGIDDDPDVLLCHWRLLWPRLGKDTLS